MVCDVAQAQRPLVYGKASGPGTHLTGRNTLVLQLLAAGEFPVATGVYEYSIEDLKMKGAPVDWIGLEPVVTYTVAVSLPSQPPRPFAAKLFIEWLLSKEGQEVINQYGRFRFAMTLNRATARFSSNTNCS